MILATHKSDKKLVWQTTSKMVFTPLCCPTLHRVGLHHQWHRAEVMVCLLLLKDCSFCLEFFLLDHSLREQEAMLWAFIWRSSFGKKLRPANNHVKDLGTLEPWYDSDLGQHPDYNILRNSQSHQLCYKQEIIQLASLIHKECPMNEYGNQPKKKNGQKL